MTSPDEAEVLVLGGASDRCWSLAWTGPGDALATCSADDYRMLVAAAGDADALPAADAAALVQARHPADPPPPPWIPRGLDAYQPDPTWWAHKPSKLHGIGHAARVLLWADRVAVGLAAAGVAIDREAVRWAALCHDCRRHDDTADDWLHGERAATWFGRQAAQIAPHLTPAQVARVAYLVRWHVPADAACPQVTPELKALKDGDGLDRVRLGDYDPRYLRTPYLLGEQARATRLWETSRDGREQPWDRVRAAARALGLWPSEVGV
jgi:uncharacterized protein